MGTSLRLVDRVHPVVVFPSAVPSSSTAAYVNLANYNHVSLVITGLNDSTGSTCAIAVNQAQDVSGTGAKALPITQMWSDADTAASDALTNVAVVSNTFSTSGTASKSTLYIVEIDAAELDVANGFKTIIVTIGNSAHQTVTVVAHLSGSRVGGGIANFPTALT